jgi:hypothetical protein
MMMIVDVMHTTATITVSIDFMLIIDPLESLLKQMHMLFDPCATIL